MLLVASVTTVPLTTKSAVTSKVCVALRRPANAPTAVRPLIVVVI